LGTSGEGLTGLANPNTKQVADIAMVWYGMVPPQPPVSVFSLFRSLRVVASFSTCPTREASGGPVNQRLLEDGFACAGGGSCTS
jgi:hypothetical protein